MTELTIRPGRILDMHCTIYERVPSGRQRPLASCLTEQDAERIVSALEVAGGLDCPDGHVCANEPLHAQAKIIRQGMTINDLVAALELTVNRHGHVAYCHADPYVTPPIPCSPCCQQTRAAIAKAKGERP